MTKTTKLFIAILILALTVTMSLPCISFGDDTYDPTLPSYEQGDGSEAGGSDQPTNESMEELIDAETMEQEETSSTAPTSETNPVYNGVNASRIPVITYHRLCSAKEKR